MGILTLGGVLVKRNRGADGKKQENIFLMVEFQRGSHISESVRESTERAAESTSRC